MPFLPSDRSGNFRSVFFGALLLSGCIGCNALSRQNTEQKNKYGGGPDQSKYVVLDEINKEHTDNLKK
ncbi:MAG: hypothetical protein WKF97_17590 [Chitinophagaceae bacterium]